ncbi:MAG: glycosyltransferase family 1 protein, partial [Deltaproteobacteria bacterium]
MNYWGSEVRVYEKAVRINPYIQVKFQKDEEAIKRNLA